MTGARSVVVQGNNTKLEGDAIVNAANSSLLGGGGVDGAIHRAAGPDLVHECRLLGGCKTGDAKLTKGYRLPARYVIHTVGPVWQGGHAGAREQGIATIAFPAISTGSYRFPQRRAAEIAIGTVREELAAHELPRQVVLCAFDDATAVTLRELLDSCAECPRPSVSSGE